MKVPLALDDGLAETWYDLPVPGGCFMGDGDVKCEQGETGPVCPECATPRTERTPATPWAMRHRLKLKFAALLVVLGFVVWQNVQAWPVMPTPSTYFRHPAVFPAHQYTRQDLARYASGETKDGRLVGDLFDGYTLGLFELEVAFADPGGRRVEATWYGWPTCIASHTRVASFDNVYDENFPLERMTGEDSGWQRTVYYDNRFDQQGGYQSFNFRARSLVPSLFLIVLSWSLGWIALQLLVVVRVCDKTGGRRSDTIMCRLPLLCAGLCAIAVTIGSFYPFKAPTSRTPLAPITSLVPTGLTANDLAHLRAEPEGSATVATAILNALDQESESASDALVFGWVTDVGVETSYGDGGWPKGYMYSVVKRSGDSNNLSPSRARLKLVYGGPWFRFLLLSGDPLERLDFFEGSLVSAAQIGFMLYGGWWAASVAIWFINRRVRRRSEKWIACGQCVRCGYDLKGI